MPIRPIKSNGRVVGYRWGKSGKLYTISKHGKKGARDKAVKQAQAIHASGYKKNYGAKVDSDMSVEEMRRANNAAQARIIDNIDTFIKKSKEDKSYNAFPRLKRTKRKIRKKRKDGVIQTYWKVKK